MLKISADSSLRISGRQSITAEDYIKARKLSRDQKISLAEALERFLNPEKKVEPKVVVVRRLQDAIDLLESE